VNPRRALWVSWERHRRSRELARALSIPLSEIVVAGPRLWRSSSCAARTVWLLLRVRPSLLFVQNPSVQLTYLACRLKPLLGYTLVVDRHSNFNFADTEHGFFNHLSNYTLRTADLTIVTNETVAGIVQGKGGRTLVLQDILPTLRPRPLAMPKSRVRIVYICSFLPDEPVEEMLGAARRLGDEFQICVTGRVPKRFQNLARSAPGTVTFTGFLPEEEYVSLLGSADVVMVLTKRENTLLCGAYEGVSLRKPLVLSNQAVLRDYFKKGVVLTENTPEAIEAAIRKAARERVRLGVELAELVPELQADWASRFEQLRAQLGLIDAAA
jgi:glycosyltransferase involved in cell wall biosynthesis